MAIYGEMAAVPRVRGGDNAPAGKIIHDVIAAARKAREPLKDPQDTRRIMPADCLVAVYETVETADVTEERRLLGFVALNRAQRRPMSCYVFLEREDQLGEVLDELIRTYAGVLIEEEQQEHRRYLKRLARVSLTTLESDTTP